MVMRVLFGLCWEERLRVEWQWVSIMMFPVLVVLGWTFLIRL